MMDLRERNEERLLEMLTGAPLAVHAFEESQNLPENRELRLVGLPALFAIIKVEGRRQVSRGETRGG